MTKIAVFGDIHGNASGLIDICSKIATADIVIFLGDLLVGGENPRECLRLLKKMKIDIWIKGNTDDWLHEDFNLGSLDETCLKEVNETKLLIDKTSADYLQNKEDEAVICVDDFQILCIHDLNTRKYNELDNAEHSKKSIVLYGHTHQQSLSQDNDEFYINPGYGYEGHFSMLEIEKDSLFVHFY